MLGLIIKKGLAGSLFGVLNVVRVCLLAAGMLTASACQSESKMLSAPVTGYNHTSARSIAFRLMGRGVETLVHIKEEAAKFAVALFLVIGCQG